MHDPTPLDEIDQFAEEADVIILGYGIAGACAALEARRAGGDVLVVERTSGAGGASALSSGIFYLGGGTEVQKAANYKDTPDNMYRSMIASMGPGQADLIRRYCDGNVKHFEWLEAQGIPFERSYYPDKTVFLNGTQGLMWSGNEKVWPFRDAATPAPRGHQVAMEGDASGAAAMEALVARCNEAGVRTIFDTTATSLIIDESGKVCGVTVRQFGERRHLHANRAVIVATGGYGRNEKMLARYFPGLPDTAEPMGVPHTDGSGINMAAEAGGDVRGMDGLIATASIYPPPQLVKGIIVNSRGRRFVAEDAYHGRTASFIMEQPDQRAFLIVDSEIFAYPEIVGANHSLVDGYETTGEMELGLGLPPGSLAHTLETYNAQAALGRDPLFEKHADWLKPLTSAPWAAFDISFNRSTYYYITLGGLRIGPDARVQRRDGKFVEGLYAAGACTAHLSPDGKSYASGMSLGPGSFFGRIAGREAMSTPD
ncbi:FAD-dependent oxidoreductase [Aurantiacibacter zhengii]|uniref:FAD-dependent oxidoreductase n=1 Tax=Aurantiacibacter zhengii TaxID=2307003 RepID=A0A418NQI2_9SPHN|nr:FAD-dependent oxidoreductase [Aurantiacibacter zhengii]RIV84986.1 FAD-dependent oxidoreductase [Aurantiacibacter zhengii]